MLVYVAEEIDSLRELISSSIKFELGHDVVTFSKFDQKGTTFDESPCIIIANEQFFPWPEVKGRKVFSYRFPAGLKNCDDNLRQVIDPLDLDQLLKIVDEAICKDGNPKKGLGEFERVRINLLESIEEIKIELYVKVSDEKYILLPIGDGKLLPAFSTIENLNKVEYLYVKSEDYVEVISLVANRLFSQLKEVDESNLSQIAPFLFKFHYLSIELAKKIGLNKTVLYLLAYITKAILEQCESIEKLAQVLKYFIMKEEYLFISEHGLMLSILCSKMIAAAEESTLDDLKGICLASLLHDVGIDGQEMNSKSEGSKSNLDLLDPIEKEQILNHPILASQLLRNSMFSETKVENMILKHHESWDGSGYPYGIDEEVMDRTLMIFLVAKEYLTKLKKVKYHHLDEELILSELENKYRNSQMLWAFDLLLQVV